MNNKSSIALHSKIFNSVIKSPNVKPKEILFGYLIGPFGALCMNSVLTGYLNLFYTDVLGLANAEKYGYFLTIFPIISAIFVVISNVFVGTLIDRTRTAQGKARPYILLSAPLFIFAAVLMFTVPKDTEFLWIIVVWVAVSYNMYYSIAYAIYNMSHSLMVPLSTRNTKQRGQLSVVSNMGNIGAAGLFASILFPMILSFLGANQKLWLFVMGAIACFATVLIFVEYYFTKERITEENFKLNIKEERISIDKQFKAIVTDRYWWIIIIFYLLYQFGSIIKNNSLTYYCNYILFDRSLGVGPDGYTQTILALLSGLPMGVGVLFVWPLANKIGKKNLALIGFAISVIGGILCLPAASIAEGGGRDSAFIIAIIGQTLKGVGGIPGVYIMMALFADILDHLECKNGFRCDGLSMSLYSAIMVAASGICMGVFNALLTSSGYVAPNVMNGITTYLEQPSSVQNVINIVFIGVEIVIHALLFILLMFLTVEKNIDKEQKIIIKRQKAKVLAFGGTWIEPEERVRLEQEKFDQEAEEVRIKELKTYCSKRGLSFEVEEAQYQKKLSEKAAKMAARAAKKRNHEANPNY
jgi:glycoside/pentoside/hexuronide:cation symporter, GPH family